MTANDWYGRLDGEDCPAYAMGRAAETQGTHRTQTLLPRGHRG